MYCNKCGKYISSGTKCDDCARADYYASQSQQTNYNYSNTSSYSRPNYNCEPEPKNRMYGFGKALTSAILGFVGYIWTYVSFVMSVDMYYGAEEAAFVLSLLALPFIIIPIIFGASSIKVFNRRKATCAKPIPTLILGIAGLSLGGIAALFEVLLFFVMVGM